MATMINGYALENFRLGVWRTSIPSFLLPFLPSTSKVSCLLPGNGKGFDTLKSGCSYMSLKVIYTELPYIIEPIKRLKRILHTNKMRFFQFAV